MAGFMKAELWQFPELDDSGASPTSGNHNSWGARCVDTLSREKLETWFCFWCHLRGDSRDPAHQLYKATGRILVSSHMQAD